MNRPPSILEAADENQKDRFGFILDKEKKTAIIIDLDIYDPPIFLKLLFSVIEQWCAMGIKQVEFQVDLKDYKNFLSQRWARYIKDKKIIFNESNGQVTTPIGIAFEIFILGYFPEYATVEN